MVGCGYTSLKNYSAIFWLHLKLIFKLLKLSPFFRGTEMLHLAVLHSRKLCVYSVSGKKHFFSNAEFVLKIGLNIIKKIDIL